jgi:hypothetical protein
MIKPFYTFKVFFATFAPLRLCAFARKASKFCRNPLLRNPDRLISNQEQIASYLKNIDYLSLLPILVAS